jgi:hypothetical protein
MEEGGRVFLTNRYSAFSGGNFIRLRRIKRNWLNVELLGTIYFDLSKGGNVLLAA